MAEISDFWVQSDEKINSDEIAMDKAKFVGKFNEYVIAKSHLSNQTLIVTDTLNNRDGVSVINSSIKELIFQDCNINFSDLYDKFVQFTHIDELNLEHKFLVNENETDARLNLTYTLKDEIEITDENVTSIKIIISGFDESSESVNLNLELLDERSQYKYKISGNTIKIAILSDMSADIAREFLQTFTYKRANLNLNKSGEIYIIINEKLLYQTETRNLKEIK